MASLHPALGIDYGDSRIGIAATDPCGILPHPVETIDRHRDDPCRRIAALVSERAIRCLVLGLPLRLDGSEGDAAAKVRRFATKLTRQLPEIPLVFIDECFTTEDAADRLRQAGRRTRHHRQVIDQAAAVEILARWLDQAGANPAEEI